jgi:autotransporter-associated beta strand protein
MTSWTAANGIWQTATNWSTTVPNAIGAFAEFDNDTPGAIWDIGFDAGTVTLGSLEINATSTGAVRLGVGGSPAVLIFDGIDGTGPLIDVDTNGSLTPSLITSDISIQLVDATTVTTRGSDTVFEIQGDISGTASLSKSGAGELFLGGNNTFSGGLFLNSGRVVLNDIDAVGDGTITFRGGDLRSPVSGTITNAIVVESGFASRLSVRGDGVVVTLDLPSFTHQGGAGTMMTFSRTSGASGTIVLATDSVTNGVDAVYTIDLGTVRFGNAYSAANFFRFSNGGQVTLTAEGTLDTGGFVTTVDNLVGTGGSIRSTGGNPLALTIVQSGGAAPMVIRVVGTNGADSLSFVIQDSAGSQTISLASLTFDDWTTGTDTIDVQGSSLADTITGSVRSDNLAGNGGDDTLDGGAGNDTLDGGSGLDQMIGGNGSDTYYADSQGDLVFENLSQGTDKVISSANFYLYQNLEQLELTGDSDLFGVGNELSNTITGNVGQNLLIGGAGNDTINGGAGVDSLFGEDGTDTLNGGAGVDYLVGGANVDTLNGGADADALYGEGGNDFLDGGDSFDTDILVGGSGNDTLDGSSGQSNPDYDLLDGGTGDDTYLVDTGDDLTFEGAGGGVDTVYANVTVPNAGVYLYTFVENLVLEGTTAFGVGNELANTLTGSASGNWLLGGLGNDRIEGEGGNDVLFGEGGADTFVFGTGSGQDVIGDFDLAQDVIEFAAYFTSFAQVQANFVQVGNDGAIDLGGGNLIVLHGVTMANLTAANFTFPSAAAPLAAPKTAAMVDNAATSLSQLDGYAFAGLDNDIWHNEWNHTAMIA